MTCARIRRTIEPDQPMPTWAHAHIAECAACRAYVEDMRRLRRALAALADVPVPEDFRHQLQARVRAAAAHSARTVALWPRALALAALGGLVFTVLFTIGRGPQKRPDVARAPRTPSVASVTPLSSPAWRSAAPTTSLPEISERRPSTSSPSMTALARSRSARAPRVTKPMAGLELASVPESGGTDPLDGSQLQDGVILLLRNEETQEESVLAIPPIVFGSRPLIPRPIPVSVAREDARRIL